MGETLSRDRLQVLARWAAQLQRDQRAEVAAAGRAIALLLDEVDRLQRLTQRAGTAPTQAGDSTTTDGLPLEARLTAEQQAIRERLAAGAAASDELAVRLTGAGPETPR